MILRLGRAKGRGRGRGMCDALKAVCQVVRVFVGVWSFKRDGLREGFFGVICRFRV
jgi:hypothetical protein